MYDTTVGTQARSMGCRVSPRKKNKQLKGFWSRHAHSRSNGAGRVQFHVVESP